MKVIENLFGEFIDCMLGIDPATVDVPYKLFGGHSIGFWIFIGAIVAGCFAVCINKDLRKKFF